ncbi:MAG: hypothetical protein KBC26_02635 [Candidatus Pacebacteria bacterium]|nr:hypothetical protein [Candidatus Paceibacterota bacterium]
MKNKIFLRALRTREATDIMAKKKVAKKKVAKKAKKATKKHAKKRR